MRRLVIPHCEKLLLIPLTLSGLVFAWLAFQPGLPDPSIQIAADAKFIGESEQQALAAFRAIANDVRAGTITDLEAADRVEIDILPAWRTARERLQSARLGPGAAHFPEELEEYFRLREEAWQALIEGVRQQDATAIERQRTKWQAADAVIAKLRADRAAKAAASR